ncbi:MAG: hypothetical protein Q4B68_07445 [Bacteroidales bacterium]|nr:hypothetical protein [Bacteroidales bacterium]
MVTTHPTAAQLTPGKTSNKTTFNYSILNTNLLNSALKITQFSTKIYSILYRIILYINTLNNLKKHQKVMSIFKTFFQKAFPSAMCIILLLAARGIGGKGRIFGRK